MLASPVTETPRYTPPLYADGRLEAAGTRSATSATSSTIVPTSPHPVDRYAGQQLTSNAPSRVAIRYQGRLMATRVPTTATIPARDHHAATPERRVLRRPL